MTNLQCNVSTCAFFDDYKCKRDKILVTGNDAKHSSETNCASYQKAGSQVNNSTTYRHGDSSTHIECEACLCQYNNNGRCDAKTVCVDCCSCREPKCESETMCAAFQCE
jgi:hypothetical protein